MRIDRQYVLCSVYDFLLILSISRDKMFTMISFVGIFLAGASLLWLSKKWASLDRNIRAAKESGIPYRVSREFWKPLTFLGFILTIL